MGAIARAYAGGMGDLFLRTLAGAELGEGSPGPLLDVGAGPGHVTRALARRGPERLVVALDLSLEMLRKAGGVLAAPGAQGACAAGTAKAPSLYLGQGAQRLRRQLPPVPQARPATCGRRCAPAPRVCGDAMSLPFRDRTFGAAVSIAALKFWPDPALGLREMGRVVRPGGRIVVVEIDRGASDERLRALLRGIRAPLPDGPWAVRLLRRHVFERAPDRERLERLGREALGGGSVVAVPDLPFLRLEASAGA